MSADTAPGPEVGLVPGPPSAGAHRARVGVALAFAAQGFTFAVVLTSLSGFEDRFSISDLVVSFVVLGVCVMAGVGTFVAERTARARGSATALVAGLTTVAAAVTVIGLAPGRPVLYLGFALYGLGLGQVDAGTNMQAVSVQRAYGRSILTSFYAAWSVGAVLGALAVSGHLAAGVPQQVAFPVVAVLVAVVAAVVARTAWRGAPVGAPVAVPLGADLGPVAGKTGPAASAQSARTVVPWRVVLVLGLAVVGFYVADTAVSTWSSLFLKNVLGAAAAVAPLGYAAYQATVLGSRVGGDLAVRRFGRVTVVRVAGITGALGLLAVVLAPSPVVGVLGFALTGAGLGVVAPLCFAAAGALAPGHADAVIARLNVFNYVGAVVGGVFTGLIASTGPGLRLGFVVPLVLAVVVAAVAPWFGDRKGAA